jgi:UDP-4-amino-4,6-dideoxy-N-acetyl-beta-L-altrosamine transaminase
MIKITFRVHRNNIHWQKEKDTYSKSVKSNMASNFIPYSRQQISEEDIQAVSTVLRSDFLTTGPVVQAFEKALQDYTGAKYAIVVSNGTAALHLAVAALELPAQSEGITSPNSFLASANCMVYNGLTPRFADTEEGTHNVSAKALEKACTQQTRLLIPVHFAGKSCDMPAIAKLARTKDLFVIEDAAHALGSRYANGQAVGCCAYSDMTIFSLHPVKNMTAGEGGVITTNNSELYQKLLLLRNHGMTRDPEDFELPEQGLDAGEVNPWYYEMQSIGFNYRLTDIQAALGLSQLQKLDKWGARKQEIARQYAEALKDLDWLQLPDLSQLANEHRHLFEVEIDFAALGKSRRQAMLQLREKGIGTQVLYIPIPLQPWYRRNLGYQEGDFPNAESYYQRALSLPFYAGLSDEEVERVVDGVKKLAG